MTAKSSKEDASKDRSLKQIAEDIISTARKTACLAGVSAENFDSVIDLVIDQALPKMSADLYESLRGEAPGFVESARQFEKGFRQRNLERWKPAFDLLEAQWAVAQEANADFFRDERTDALQNDDVLFEALISLHARALLVAKESICLLQGGFPDGAMSRWRTLHEFNIVAHFLLLKDESTARLYLASAHFQALKHAKQARKYAHRDQSIAISDDVVSALEERCAELKLTLGFDLSEDYAWAHAALNRRRVTLFELEQATDRDFWRPRYRWASQHIHGSHQGSRGLLGMSETEKHVKMLVGPSNGGLVDPIQMIAHSIADVSEALLFSKPDIVRKVAASVLWLFAEDIGPIAMKCEEDFRRLHGYDPDR
ncbi:DUF5677 domain-containing protein [Acidocella facilis]|uniref:DUF5677 domain-containing protein n=1 Tax=Acidocella facilis TaxID=525 RepID=UPI001F2CD6B8|nr:DUF5677 domain-containing protein [Acidocella facilis]